MAPKVVATNKVCESLAVCNRPPTDTLPHQPHCRESIKTRRESWMGLTSGFLTELLVSYFVTPYFEFVRLICFIQATVTSV